MAESASKVIIKKYANRRLYDTESSSYITLDRLAQMIREGREFEVVDAKSGEDITRQVLTQIIVDEEAGAATMLPVNFLRQLIGLYGGQMSQAVPHYLEAAMESFAKNQAAMAQAFGGASINPAQSMFADMAKRNMAMFEQAARGFPGADHGAAKGGAAKPDKDAELAALKAELASLKSKIDKLGQ